MADLGRRFGRGAGGAASGALAGASLGPWGAAIGAGIGGLKGFLTGNKKPSIQQMQGSAGGNGMAGGSFFGGTQNRYERVPKYNEQQNDVLNQILQMGIGGLQNPQAGFEPIANKARSQFAQQTVPGLAERFTQMGQSSTMSPQFASQLGSAGAGLEEALAALSSQYGLQNQSQLLQMLGLGLNPRDEINYFEGEPGFGQMLGQQGLKTAGQYGPMALSALAGRKGQTGAGGESLSGGQGWLNNLIKLLSSQGG